MTRQSGVRLFLLVSWTGFTTLAAPGKAEELQPPILCSLDFTSGRFVPGGFEFLSSWAADSRLGAPVARMDVLLDGSIRGDVQLSGHRPDVARHFRRADYLWSGWTATVSLKDVDAGSHSIEVIAYSRSGEKVSCGIQDLTVRPFSRPAEPPSWRIAATLLTRVIAFVVWLSFTGWGLLRLIGVRRIGPLSPAVGLALFAVATEAGAVSSVNPVTVALILTGLSATFLAISAIRRPIRFRRPDRALTIALAGAALFCAVGCLPLIRYGPGAVLGSIADAAWECSVGDSIARFGWTIPRDIHGHLAAVPSVWRAADFRAGAPYPLALLAQLFRVRAYEVHSVLILAVGALVVFVTGSLARFLFRRSILTTSVAVGLVATSSVLFTQLYNQHAGILIATFLYVSFLFGLLSLLPRRRVASAIPLGLILAGSWTLYPEAMFLWATTAVLALLLSRNWRRAKRSTLRLILAVGIAAAVNPIGLARTTRFTMALRHATAIATPDLRMAFGDTHYFPSMTAVIGLEPYRMDAPAAREGPARFLLIVAGSFLLLTWGQALLGVRRRTFVLIALLVLPVSSWFILNRLLKFPYGYSKGLSHGAAVWPLVIALLYLRSWNLSRALTIVSIGLLAVTSTRGGIQSLTRASRTVPAYDPAFRTLSELMEGVPRSAVILTDEPVVARREWIAYFLGENRVIDSNAPPSSVLPDPGAPRYRLVDRRSDVPGTSVTPVRSNSFFALLPQ